MDSHRAAFVAEAEDGITDLNNALLALEADPEDAAAMDDVFRVAHTLKGNAAAMGYEDVSSFGHALEDLLDAVRQGDREVTPELMDLLFEGVDTVEAMVAEIADTGDVSTDPSDLESRLRAMEEHGSVDGEAETDDSMNADAGEPATADATPPEDGFETAAVDVDGTGGEDTDGTAADETDGTDETDDTDGIDETDDTDGIDETDDTDGIDDTDDTDGTNGTDVTVPEGPAAVDELDDPVVYADVTIGETSMAGVDAALVLQALDGQFDGHVTDPEPAALEDGEYDEGFDAFVGAADPTAVAEGLGALTQVDSVTTALVGDVPVDAADAADATDEVDTTDAVDDGSDLPADEPEPIDEEDPEAEGSAVQDSEAAGSEEQADQTESGSKPSGSGDRDEIKSIRVDVDQVDELYGLVEQLVTSRIKLRRELEEADAQSDALDELDKLASSLQDTAMDMRLIPFSQVSDSFPRLVRDISRDLDKQIAFDIEGDDVELDRTILTEMRDPLVHVLRNAVDHGIEPPAEREAAGKDPTGRVELTAERERDHVIIEVADDGGGLDPDQLREKAVDEGVKSREAVEAMEDDEVYDLVFHPGFSTAEEVTDVSGRGVGMDVVRTTARDLDGSVSVESDPGAGTTVRFRLPVTVAIVKVMFVDVGGTEYGIPIKSIAEVARADDVEEVHGDEIVRHEDDLYPVIRLNERLADAGVGVTAEAGSDPVNDPVSDDGSASATTDGGVIGDGTTGVDLADENATDEGMLVRIREETRQVALHCDAVLDQEEVVVKPLDGPLSGTPGLSGTAVLGDGDVVAVLDVVSL